MQTSNIYYWSINWQIVNQQYLLLTVLIDKLQTSNIYYWQYLLTKLQTSNIYYWQYLLTNCRQAIYIIDSIYWQIANKQYILLTVFIDKLQTSNIYYWQYSLTNCKPAIYIIDSIYWQIANYSYFSNQVDVSLHLKSIENKMERINKSTILQQVARRCRWNALDLVAWDSMNFARN